MITSYRTHSPELQAAAPEHQEAPGPEEQAEGSELVLLVSNLKIKFQNQWCHILHLLVSPSDCHNNRTTFDIY